MLPSDKEYFPPMPFQVYLYLSRSASLVSFTDRNKQLLKVKYVLELLNRGRVVSEIYGFITFLGI